MKIKHLFLSMLLILVASSAMFAQGNLQFNQVVRMEWTAILPTNASALYQSFGVRNFVVPAGKVLKIESMNISLNRSTMPALLVDPQSLMNGNQLNEPPMLFLNNTVVHINGEVNQAGITKTQIIWLPAGTYDFYMGARSSSSVAQDFSALVTAIEFNIVP